MAEPRPKHKFRGAFYSGDGLGDLWYTYCGDPDCEHLRLSTHGNTGRTDYARPGKGKGKRMKKVVVSLMLLALLFGGAAAEAATVKLGWDYPTPTPADVVGFKLYRSSVSGQVGTLVQTLANPAARELTYDAPGLADGTYWFTLTAYDSANESDKSNEVKWLLDTVKPAPPTNARVVVSVQVTVGQ